MVIFSVQNFYQCGYNVSFVLKDQTEINISGCILKIEKQKKNNGENYINSQIRKWLKIEEKKMGTPNIGKYKKKKRRKWTTKNGERKNGLSANVYREKLCNIDDTFRRVIGILVNWHISTDIWRGYIAISTLKYPTKCVNSL